MPFYNLIISLTCRGDSQVGVSISTLILPSLNRKYCSGLFYFNSDVGEIHRVVNFNTLVLPSMILPFWAFWGFWHFAKWGPMVWWWDIIVAGCTPILYIYSLRHFLTTKGALIDGDGYPPKNPKNDLKKVTKMTKNWLKLMTKNDQKQCFLMAKSSFSVKLIQLTQKTVKNHSKLIIN